MPSPTILARNELGAATRARDPERITRARQCLAAEKIAAYAARVAAEAPPLTAAQIDRITAALRPAGADLRAAGGDAQ